MPILKATILFPLDGQSSAGITLNAGSLIGYILIYNTID
jgi:hypothetical protein